MPPIEAGPWVAWAFEIGPGRPGMWKWFVNKVVPNPRLNPSLTVLIEVPTVQVMDGGMWGHLPPLGCLWENEGAGG